MENQVNNPHKGKAIGSMVCGIISVILCWFGYAAIVSLILSIVGLVLGANAKKGMAADGIVAGKGMATAGVVLSIISLVLSAIVFVACTLCAAAGAAAGLF